MMLQGRGPNSLTQRKMKNWPRALATEKVASCSRTEGWRCTKPRNSTPSPATTQLQPGGAGPAGTCGEEGDTEVAETPLVHGGHHMARLGLVLQLHPLLRRPGQSVTGEAEQQQQLPRPEPRPALPATVLVHEHGHPGHDHQDEEVLQQGITLLTQQHAQHHHRNRFT